MSMIDDIVAWSQNVAPWQADAIRRLLTQGSLTTTDKEELYRMLKDEFSLLVAGESAPTPVRPQLGAVSGAPAAQTQVRLHAIEAVQNVNAIPDNSRLPFGTTGLTVIYGQNGSGKSGYARILKRACKARDTDERILPNVRPAGGSTASLGPAKAGIKVQVGTCAPQILAWADGQHHEVLTNVAVFDSNCARITVEEDNAPLYVPYGADVFPRLGELMTDFRRRLPLEAPKAELIQLAGVLPGTGADALLRTLSPTVTDDTLDKTCTWSSNDEKRLVQVNDLVTRDPTALATGVDAKRRRLELLRDDLARLDSAVSDTGVATLHDHFRTVAEAEQAAEALAKSISDEPLSGIGGQAWRALYDAAREYSTSSAYPGAEFPQVGAGSRCVLCMQPLAADGAERLSKFRTFMENRTSAVLKEAKRQLKDALESSSRTTSPTVESYVDVLNDLNEKDPAAAATLRSHITASTERLAAIKKSPTPDLIGHLPTYVPIPITHVDEHIKRLATEAATLRSQAEPERQKELLKERSELQSRKALAESKEVVRRHVADLRRKDAFTRCAASLDTLSTSKKGKEMVTATFTPEFRRLLTEELRGLDADYLRILPKPTAKAGETCHKLSLEGTCKTTKADVSEVLSEGEHRVVAVAGFLAELAASGQTGPIVLDDPVSSLDHVFRDRIAKRLVLEAARRQVVVFTHDISMLLELESRAMQAGTIPWTAVTVSRHGLTPGFAEEGMPSEAKSYGATLQDLRQELGSFAADYDNVRGQYNVKAAGLYDRLRGAIEVFVEEVLLDRAVKRHDIRVSVDALRGVECTTDTYKRIQIAYSECGRWGAAHSNARPLSADRPKPDEVKVFISELEALSRDIKQRRKDLRVEREAALKPQPGQPG